MVKITRVPTLRLGAEFPSPATDYKSETADLASVGLDRQGRNAAAINILYGSASGFVARHQYWGADVVNLPGDPERNDRFGLSLAAAKIIYR